MGALLRLFLVCSARALLCSIVDKGTEAGAWGIIMLLIEICHPKAVVRIKRVEYSTPLGSQI